MAKKTRKMPPRDPKTGAFKKKSGAKKRSAPVMKGAGASGIASLKREVKGIKEELAGHEEALVAIASEVGDHGKRIKGLEDATASLFDSFAPKGGGFKAFRPGRVN